MSDEKNKQIFLFRSHEEKFNETGFNFLRILTIIATEAESIGLTEEEIKAKCLDKEKFMEYLAEIEKAGYLESSICQKDGTGLFLRRYKLKEKIEIIANIKNL